MTTNNSTTTTGAEPIALDDLAHDVELLRIVEDQIGKLTVLPPPAVQFQEPLLAP